MSWLDQQLKSIQLFFPISRLLAICLSLIWFRDQTWIWAKLSTNLSLLSLTLPSIILLSTLQQLWMPANSVSWLIKLEWLSFLSVSCLPHVESLAACLSALKLKDIKTGNSSFVSVHFLFHKYPSEPTWFSSLFRAFR